MMMDADTLFRLRVVYVGASFALALAFLYTVQNIRQHPHAKRMRQIRREANRYWRERKARERERAKRCRRLARQGLYIPPDLQRRGRRF